MALFEATDLHKRFGTQVVLERISLRFEEGRLSGIMGPNGAGKTTCFNVLTGRYRPDGGRVVFDGNDITGMSPREIACRGLARSFQVMNLFNDECAIDNIVIALPRVRAKEHTPARRLSYGERRALEIGIALAARPRLLFLDEPTAGLGVEGTARLAELVAELKRQLTIVIIEHDMKFLFGLADRISVIHWGQVIAEGSPDALRHNPWVQRSGLGAAA